MSDIQQARDVLAKWRKAARDGEWSIGADTAESSWLGRGTAGNPESLDADDALLALALEYGNLPKGSGSRFIELAERKAASIIAADEAMSR